MCAASSAAVNPPGLRAAVCGELRKLVHGAGHRPAELHLTRLPRAAFGAVQPVQCRALWSPFGIHTGLACKRGRYAGHGTGCAGHWHGAAIGRAGAPRLLRRRGFALGGRGAEAVAAHCTQQACSATTYGTPGTKSGAPSQLDQYNIWHSWYETRSITCGTRGTKQEQPRRSKDSAQGAH